VLIPRERLIGAVEFKPVDRVPVFEQEIASNVASEILGRRAFTGGGGIGWREIAEAIYRRERDRLTKHIVEDLIELTLKLRLDGIRPPLVGISGAKKKIGDDTYYFEDDDSGAWSIMRYIASTMEYQLIDSSARKEGVPAIERMAERLYDSTPEIEDEAFDVVDAVTFRVGRELAIAGSQVMGIPIDAPWLIASVTRPDLIAAHLDWQLKYSKELLRSYKVHGVDFILGGGDLAGKQGPVYSRSTFRSLVLPRLRRLVEFSHELGLPYFYRTDGNVWAIADLLLGESGVDGFGEIDLSAGMKLGEIRNVFPRLALWGGVDCARTLVFGTEEEVRRETIQSMLEAGAGGGLILGSSNTIHPTVRVGNFLEMLDTAMKYGAYPIDTYRLVRELGSSSRT